MKLHLLSFIFLILSCKSFAQIARNKEFDTLKESIKASAYDIRTKKIIDADHHYCMKDNYEFMVNFGFPNSFWPFRFEDENNKKDQLKLDHLKFAKLGYLPLLYELQRPVYNKTIKVFLEKLFVDSLYEMDNIVFNPDLSIDQNASSHALYLYKKYLLEKNSHLNIEILDVRSINVKTIDDKKKAAANLIKLLGFQTRIKVNLKETSNKESNNIIEFKVLKL